MNVQRARCLHRNVGISRRAIQGSGDLFFLLSFLLFLFFFALVSQLRLESGREHEARLCRDCSVERLR